MKTLAWSTVLLYTLKATASATSDGKLPYK